MSNTVNYFEIGTPDSEATQTFYNGMFDWQIAEPSEYRMVDEDKGGVWDTSAQGGDNWAIFYVQVDDVAAALKKAQALGGSVVVPRVDNGRIEFAHLRDPHGNRFGVWHPKG